MNQVNHWGKFEEKQGQHIHTLLQLLVQIMIKFITGLTGLTETTVDGMDHINQVIL
jgi:hypothetical protein